MNLVGQVARQGMNASVEGGAILAVLHAVAGALEPRTTPATGIFALRVGSICHGVAGSVYHGRLRLELWTARAATWIAHWPGHVTASALPVNTSFAALRR